MKKFLIFLVAIVVSVCVGVTAFYFLRNDEIISIDKYEIFINEGDFVSIKGNTYNSIGLKSNEKHSRTKYGYRVENMEGENITNQNIFTYDDDNDVYIAKEGVGGEYKFVVTTTNKKYKEFKVTVKIGNGEKSNPYYIRNKDEFQAIRFDKCYLMLGDVTLDDNTFIDVNFSGELDGNGYSVKGLNLKETNTAESIGLFKNIQGNAVVKNLTISNPKIVGSYKNVGALSGSISGSAKIVGVKVVGAEITNNNLSGYTGGLTGTAGEVNVLFASVEGSSTKESIINVGSVASGEPAVAERTADIPYVGGLIGYADKTTIKASFANVVINDNVSNESSTLDHQNVGGLVGVMKLAPATDTKTYDNVKGVVHQSYAVVSGNAEAAAFVGRLTADNAIVQTSWNEASGVVSDGTNTHTYAYFVGNYGLNNETTDARMVKSSDDNAKAVLNLINQQPEGDNKFTFINKIKQNQASDGGYLYYDNVLWDSSVWKIANESYPKLIMNISENNISTVPNSYIASTIKTTIGREEDFEDSVKLAESINKLKTIVQKENMGNVEAILPEGTTLDWQDINTTETTTGSLSFAYPVNIKVKNGLFKNFRGSLENATILVESFDDSVRSTYGAVANTLQTGSTLNNIKVTFNANVNKSVIETFGGVVGVSQAGTTITDCYADNIAVTDSNITTIGGIVGSLNGKLVLDNGGNAQIKEFKSSKEANVGGLVGVANSGALINKGGKAVNSEVAVEISVTNIVNNTNIGGAVGVVEDNAQIENITLTGKGINYKTNMTATDIYIGGVAATNNGRIDNVYNTMASIANKTLNGSNEEVFGYANGNSYNYKVAGVAWNNSGKINKAIVKTNLYGNYVAGVVGETSGIVSEVFVAGINWNKAVNYVLDNSESEGVKFSQGANIIAGNKYVVGVAYAVNAGGSVTDVQTNSIIKAGENGTKASLIVGIFPERASVKDLVINSKFEGNTNATYYRDTMIGGEISVNGGKTYEYNIYGLAGGSGVMTSVVVNTETMRSSGVVPSNYVQAKFRQYWAWFSEHVEYNEDGNGSYVREVNNADFAKENIYTGSFTLYSESSNTDNYDERISCGSKKMTFGSDKWSSISGSNVGKILTFVANL